MNFNTQQIVLKTEYDETTKALLHMKSMNSINEKADVLLEEYNRVTSL